MSLADSPSTEILPQALFDERYYRLAHPDVDQAVERGQVESGYSHYLAYGCGERRAMRRNLLPGFSLPNLIAIFRGSGDFLSGVKLRLIDREAIKYRFAVYALGLRGIGRVAEIDIDREAEIVDGRVDILWAPITRSKGRWFVSRLFRLSSEGEPVSQAEFLLAESNAQMFSPPISQHATPPLLQISPVTQCNLNCIHCISRPTRKQVREISPEVWRQFEALAAEKRVYEITADYSGDILYAQGRSNAWLDRIMALQVDLRITTHANNLSLELAETLINSSLRGINFSIDSFEPEDYLRIRKGALPLEQVLANIGNFMRLRNIQRPDLHTALSLVLMRRNLSSLIPAIDFAAEHRINLVYGVHLMAFTPDMAEHSAMLDLKAYRESYEAAVAYADRKGVNFVAPPPIRKLKPRKGHSHCDFPWSGAMVTGDGDVNACCMPGSVVGNLNKEPLEAIWNGPRMRAFRARVNTSDPPSPCGECGFYRHENNFESYVPGLSKTEREAFVAQVLAQF